MAKVLLVLYPDPVTGYPPVYARDSIPVLDGYPGGQTLPTPSAIDFTPGQLLGCVSGELGLRAFLENSGHELIVTSDKDGPDSEFERQLLDADVVISQPFWPAYLTAERIAKAKDLKLALTAGIGSDHVDLDAAIARGLTVAEVTFCNSISVAEHAVMQILALVRNFVPSHQWVVDGGWNIADCVERAYDVEGMDVGVIAAGRIGRDERWAFRELSSEVVIYRNSLPIYLNRSQIIPEVQPLTQLGWMEDFNYLASIIVVGEVGPQWSSVLSCIETALDAIPGINFGASEIACGGWVVRFMTRTATDLTIAKQCIWAIARRSLLGLEAFDLRK